MLPCKILIEVVKDSRAPVRRVSSSLCAWLRQAQTVGDSSDALTQILLFFTKAGAFVFGSGLAIIPFLQQGVVQQFGWLTQHQFLDAVAVAIHWYLPTRIHFYNYSRPLVQTTSRQSPTQSFRQWRYGRRDGRNHRLSDRPRSRCHHRPAVSDNCRGKPYPFVALQHIQAGDSYDLRHFRFDTVAAVKDGLNTVSRDLVVRVKGAQR